MNKLLVSFIIAVGMIIYGCNGKTAKKELKSIDSLQTVLKQTEAAMLRLDTATMNDYFHTSTKTLNYIQQNFRDTMDRESGIMLSDYKAAKKSMGRWIENYYDQTEALKFSKDQLNNLRIDLENNLVEKENFDQYFQAEFQAILNLNESIQNLIEWHATAIRQFEKRNPEVQQLYEKIIKEKYSDRTE